MRRDWDVVRRLLAEIEASPEPNKHIDSNSFEEKGIGAAAAAYHLYLLLQADLINGGFTKTLDAAVWC